MAPADAGSPGRSTPAIGQSLTLHLGVIDQPYRSRTKKAASVTTGQVATWLEDRYAIMAAFYRTHEGEVAKAVESSLVGAFEALLTGNAVDPWGRATQVIGERFRNFISSQMAERVGIPGTPTKAALRGVNHRLAHPYGRGRPGRPRPNPRRPSFRDTGLYQASFRAWID